MAAKPLTAHPHPSVLHRELLPTTAPFFAATANAMFYHRPVVYLHTVISFDYITTTDGQSVLHHRAETFTPSWAHNHSIISHYAYNERPEAYTALMESLEECCPEGYYCYTHRPPRLFIPLRRLAVVSNRRPPFSRHGKGH